MGKKWGKKKGAGGQAPRRPRTNGKYEVAVKENKNFETYYKAQKIVPEEEWDAFMSTLTDTLPVAFRITGLDNQAKAFNKILEEQYFEPLKDVSALQASVVPRVTNGTTEEAPEEEEPIKALEPKRLQWYPGQLAYQLNLSRKDIRRSEAYWRLHQCLISETGAGSISRQETVSMIPPLLMDIQPQHRVLDMCAAPGSKTAQLIEQLHSGGTAIPSGVVVANDADNKRCYLLTHQAKRLQSPAMMVTNHDAAFMPNFLYTKADGATGKLKFDRILCDVPCSGDGTLRKNCDIWTKWNPVNGANLHGLQLRIARRGLEMLSIGGRLVYSTCSMSPLENEAVLQRLLLEANGGVELVDVSQELPGLKTSPGLSHWTVMDKEMNVIPSAEDIPTNLTNIFSKHVFPANNKGHNLHRCLRLLPHAQDTGAFFVAVLKKTRPMPGEGKGDRDVPAAPSASSDAPNEPSDTTKTPSDAPNGTPDAPAPVKQTRAPLPQRHKSAPKKRPRGYKEEPYFYLCDAVGKLEEDRAAGRLEVSMPEKSGNEASAPAAQENGSSTQEDEPKSETEEAKTSTNGAGSTEGSEAKPEPAKPKTPVNPEVEDVRVWSQISEFFGFNREVPAMSYQNFMSRTKEHNTRNLYFTNSLVRDLVTRNQDRMKIINTGVRAFVRAENKGATCAYRVSQEGVACARALLSRARVLRVARDDLVTILNDNDNATPPELAAMSPMCQAGAKAMVSGSVLMEYHGDPSKPEEAQEGVPEEDKIKVSLVGWKGASSLRCYVAKDDRVHFLRLLRADTSRYATNKFQVARDAAAAGEVEGEEQEAIAAEEDAEPDCEEAPAKKIKLDVEA